MKNFVIFFIVFFMLSTLNIFGDDYSMATLESIECTKYVNGEVFRLYIGDNANNRFNLFINKNYEDAWFSGSEDVFYSGTTIKIAIICDGKNISFTANITTGLNIIEYTLKNKTKLKIKIRV